MSVLLYMSIFSNIFKNKQGAKAMYDILNKNEDNQTAQQTCKSKTNFIILKKTCGKKYMCTQWK